MDMYEYDWYGQFVIPYMYIIIGKGHNQIVVWIVYRHKNITWHIFSSEHICFIKNVDDLFQTFIIQRKIIKEK